MSRWLTIPKQTFELWWAHSPTTLGAALAYYTVFSIGPLLVIAIGIAGLFFGQDSVRTQVADQLQSLVGPTAANAIDALLASANQQQRQGKVALVIGLVILLFTAIGVVSQLKYSINTIWEAKPKPDGGIWSFACSYVISLAAVISLGFLLLISLLVSAAVAALGARWAPDLPQTWLHGGNFLISYVITSLLFALMFKWLPDAEIEWGDVWLGGFVTGALFEAGKFLIGLYVARMGLESSYAGAGSVVILLIWVYYSAQIVLLGAAFTRAYAAAREPAVLNAKPQPASP